MNEKYLKQYFKEGEICPFCGLADIESLDQPNIDGNSVILNVNCSSEKCGKEWREYYTLSKIDYKEEKITTVLKGQV